MKFVFFDKQTAVNVVADYVNFQLVPKESGVFTYDGQNDSAGDRVI